MTAQPTLHSPGSPLLVVQVADDRLALPGSAVRELGRWRPPTPVPGASPLIAGLVSQRGAVLPVVDLRLARGRAATPPGRAARLVVVRHAAVELALLVDAVHDLVAADLLGSDEAPSLIDLDALLAAVQAHTE